MSLIETINAHVEDWDSDCETSYGCSCGWRSEECGSWDPEKVTRQQWREHLAGHIALTIRVIAETALGGRS